MTISFKTVAQSEVPTRIRRRGAAGKWATAVAALHELENGQALAFDVEDNAELARIRNGLRGAATAEGIELATRTVPAPTEDHPEAGVLYIIKVEVMAEDESEGDDEDDDDA